MKKFLSLTALFLALCLLFCACGKKQEAADTAGEGAPGYPPADKVMDGDTVMFTAAGGSVTWAELYYWMVSSLELTREEAGGLPDWDEMVQGMTFAEFTRLDAARAALLYRVVEQKAAEMDLKLSAEDEAALENLRADAIDYFGGEKAYQEYLDANYLTEELYTYLQRVSSLYFGLFVGYFGENGEKCTDTDAVGVVENEGYIYAKHILVESREEAEDLLAQLDAAQDPEASFDALMAAHTSDPGYSYYPQGYLFTRGDMGESFYEAAGKLEYDQYSGVVETDSGYHIIYRMPIDPDMELDEGYTVRYYAASLLFENIVSQWAEEAEAAMETTEAYQKLDLQKIFSE